MRTCWAVILLIFFHSYLASESTLIVLLGKPGAGKGTYAIKLREDFHLPHISTGELIKEHIRQGTPLGKIAQQYVESGTFPPEDLIADMFFEHYQSHDYSQGCILDGFPRTLYQAQMLDKRLGPTTKISFIYLRVSDERAKERILGRLMCARCYATYNIVSAPPAKPGICDYCHANLYHRQDDCLDVIKTRLTVFHEKTAPVIQHYRAQHRLHEIDSDQPVDTVYAAVLKAVQLHR